MKRIFFIIILLINISVFAQTSSIVMDVDSGRILYQNNAYERKLIASTTKIMTFVVAYEYAKDYLDVLIEAGDEILKMYGTSIYLSYHEEMKLRDLLYGLLMRSGNDASVVIAKFVGGSEEEFVKLMNKKAQFIGMNNTIFSNPHGLDENTQNYSTAYDMALLSCYANKIPLYRQITSTKYYKTVTSFKAYSWTNRNKMLFTYPFFVSGKTGYTPKAGRTYVSSAQKDNLHLTIVTLDDPNHYENHRLLYDKMFEKYQNTLIMSKENFELQYPSYYIKKDLFYPLTKEEKISIQIIQDKGTLKELKIYLNNQEIISEKIYQNTIIEKESINLWKKIKKIIKKVFH